MPRIARRHLVAEDTVNHCTWRSCGDMRVFEEPGARAEFKRLLTKYKAIHAILIFSYCLMGTHPHVLCMSKLGQAAFSAFWKDVNQAFARWFNKQRGRNGQVVRERMVSPIVEAGGRHMLAVMRYGDLNPVRAGLVASAKEWEWSSYRHYAFGERDPLIDDAPDYLALGQTAPSRRKAYQALFAERLPEKYAARRVDVVYGPFFGSPAWAWAQYERRGLAPPGGRMRGPS